MFYFIKEGLLKCGLYLQGGLYSEVVLNTGLTIVDFLLRKKKQTKQNTF